MKRREFLAAMVGAAVAPAAVPAMREASNTELMERWLLAPHPFGSVVAIRLKLELVDGDDRVLEGIQKAIAMCREDVSRAKADQGAFCGPKRANSTPRHQGGKGMNQETFDQVEQESTRRIQRALAVDDLANKLRAKEAVVSVIREKVASGEALVLTDEEEQVLLNFRQFKKRLHQDQKRALFRFRTSPTEGIVEPPETVLIEHPNTVEEP